MASERVPNGWTVQHVEQFAAIKTGNRDTQNRIAGGKYPFIVRSQTVERIDSYGHDGEAVLTAGDGVGTGKVFHYLNGKFDYHQRVYNIHEFAPHVVGKFFFYYFQKHFIERVRRLSAKNSVDSVRRAMIAEMRIPLPPLPEQRKIAAILTAVDETIEKTEAVIEQLGVVKKAMMQELLTRGLPGRHTRFKETEIGEIPEEWEICTVREAGEVVAGKAKNKRLDAPNRPYLRVANVFDGRIDISDVLQMPFTDAEFARYRLRAGDILLNEGQSLELVGRCAMYREEYPDSCAIQNALIRFRPGRGLRAAFAEQVFRWYQHSGRFASVATQTTSIAHLGVQRFASMFVSVPQLEEQDKIMQVLDGMDTRIRAEKATVAALSSTKSALMSVLLTGELRVTPDDAA